MPRELAKYRAELKQLAQTLPYSTSSKARLSARPPPSVRQRRTYVNLKPGMQAIGRFLVDRGVVDILPPEHILQLFHEIHWCANEVRKLARKRYRTRKMCEAALTQARKLISQIEEAEEELFIANRRLVVRCLRPYFWLGQTWIEDFLQEGARALSHAIRRFDPARGTPFYAYAQRVIQNRLRNAFRDHVRAEWLTVAPSSALERLRAALESWEKTHKKAPSVITLARLTGLSRQEVTRLKPLLQLYLRAPGAMVSLDAPAAGREEPLGEQIPDHAAEAASESAQKDEIWRAVQTLAPRSRRIIELRFRDGQTLQEIGDELGLTRARIKQIQDEALRKLKHILHRPEKQPRMARSRGK